MIRILSDIPSGEDDFSSGGDDLGPHERIAAALERRILSEEGAGAIGLQGDLGSGKTNIVKMLRKRFRRRSEVCFVVFDAWSHDGDPLRRSFLETLIDAFISKDYWICESEWRIRKEKLAQKIRNTKETKTSSPSRFAILLALATGLVPIGLLVGKEGLETATLKLEWNLPISWTTLAGFVLLAGPILVAMGNLLRLFSAWIFGKRKVQTFAQVFDLKHWSFLSQHGTVESQSDTIETTDRTTLEFEADFDRLLAEALKDQRHRVVLVIDNLDRLSASQSLAIWSSLQTFISSRALTSNESFAKRFSLIVPFSPNALKEIWTHRDGVANAETLFEKTFRVRYDTPPPTIADRKAFLNSLLNEAISDLNPTDLSIITEVFNLARRERLERIVPRQMKIFVNQLAVLRDLWGDELPVSHLAYSVLHSADRTVMEDCLRYRSIHGKPIEDRDSESTSFPSQQAIQICGATLTESLAAVYFNVPPAYAMQLLIEFPIEIALSKGDDTTIQELRNAHPSAFWTVLLSLVSRSVSTQSPEELTKWSAALAILREPNLPLEAQRIREYVRMRLEEFQGNWSPLNKTTTTGLCDWLTLDASELTERAVIKIATRTLKSAKQDGELDARLAFAEQLHELGLAPSASDFNAPWRVHMDPTEWIDNGAQRAVDASGKAFIDPTCTTKSIVELLCARARFDPDSEPELTESNVSAFGKLKRIRDRVEASELLDAIHTTLKENLALMSNESTVTVAACFRRLHQLRLLNEERAETILKDEEIATSTISLLAADVAETDDRAALIASLCWSNPKLELGKEIDGLPEEGQKKLNKLRNSGDLEFTKHVWEYFKCFDCRTMIGNFAGKSYNGLSLDIVEHATADEMLPWAMPCWYLKVNAKWLLSNLSKRETDIQVVIAQLEEDGSAIDHFMSNADISMESDRNSLEVLTTHGSDKLVAQLQYWTREQLLEVDSETWEADLRGDNHITVIAEQIQGSSTDPLLSSAFKNALLAILPDLLQGEMSLKEKAESAVHELITCMTSDVRRDLGARALRMIATKQELNGTVANLFGDAMLESSAELSPEETVDLIVGSLKSQGANATRWCVEFNDSRGLSVDDLAESKLNLLREEISASLREDCDDSTRETLIRIRDMYGISENEHLVEEQESYKDSESVVQDD